MYCAGTGQMVTKVPVPAPITVYFSVVNCMCPYSYLFYIFLFIRNESNYHPYLGGYKYISTLMLDRRISNTQRNHPAELLTLQCVSQSLTTPIHCGYSRSLYFYLIHISTVSLSFLFISKGFLVVMFSLFSIWLNHHYSLLINLFTKGALVGMGDLSFGQWRKELCSMESDSLLLAHVAGYDSVQRCAFCLGSSLAG